MPISLVTPIRDEVDTIQELIDGVRQQTRPPDEWIVVDGGSQDGTLEILRASRACRVLEVEGNIARGRNAGIAASSGEIVATLDAGCRPGPDWLHRLVQPIEAASARVTAGLTVPLVSSPFHAAQAALLDQFVVPGASLRLPALSARSLAFRKDVWSRCSFPEWLDIGEDAWLLKAWSRQGNPPQRVPEAVVEWRLRPTVGAVVRQHFRYMRGDGRATMNTHRHLLRIGFYALIAVVVGLGPTQARWQAGAAWALYGALSAVRLKTLTAPPGILYRLKSWLWALVLLPMIDVAKIAGYVTGLLDRLTAGSPSRAA